VVSTPKCRLSTSLTLASDSLSLAMSTLLCAWAHVDESTHEQYASHIASVAARLDTRAWHFEAEESPLFQFETSTLGNTLTVYAEPTRAHCAMSLCADALALIQI
jgi:hypothetical protein